jgi:hypothetical protein
MIVSAFLLTISTVTPYLSWGWHGGYYLTDEMGYFEALDRLFKLLEEVPEYKAFFELEPYALERMLHGERFEVERRGRNEPRSVGWGYGGPGKWEAKILKDASRTGKMGLRLTLVSGEYVNCCQTKDAARYRGKTLIFSGWIRVHRGTGAHLYIDAWDEKGYIPGSSKLSERVSPDGEWHFTEIEFRVPENAKTIFPQAKIAGDAGVADFDDLSLKVKETGEELLFNGSFEMRRVPSLKDLRRLKRLRELVEEGRIEIVGGAYTQPITFTIGSESVIRQFVLGCKAVEEALGVPVKIYAAQEPDMAGQLPQILKGCGFKGVLYRTHWGAFGFTPSCPRNFEKVIWIGPDGTGIETVPMLEALRSGWGIKPPSPGAARELERAEVEKPLFTILPDFCPQWVPGSESPEVRGIFGGGWANVCKKLDAVELRGRELLFSGRIRARKPGAHIYIDAHDEKGRAKAGLQSRNVPPDGEWHEVKIAWRVPEDALYIFPQGRILSIEGDADFKELSLKLLPEGRELLSGFPEGWGIGRSEGAEVEEELGKGYVRLKMRGRSVKVNLVTLEEYFELVGEPGWRWADAYAGFEHRFPWGLLAGRPQRADRAAEDTALKVERLFSIIGSDPGEDLRDVWRLIMMGHHHDAWVCAPVIFGIWRWGFKRYADLTYAASEEARDIAEGLVKSVSGDGWEEFVVVNVSGHRREGIVPLNLTLPEGLARSPSFEGPEGVVPAEVEVVSRYPDGSAKEVKAFLLADVSPMGFVRFKTIDGEGKELPEARVEVREGTVVMENGFIRVELSGDGLLQVYSKDGEPLLRSPAFITGRFREGDLESEVKGIEGFKEGPFAVGRVRGSVGDIPFIFEAKLDPISPLIKLGISFDFKGDVVGEGEESSDVPVWVHDELKLRFVLPLPFEGPRFLAHGAFELREPYEERFQILRYGIAEGDGRGVAIYTDRATGAIFRKEPPSMEIILAYGGRFIYAPGKIAPLEGEERYELRLYFYEGDYEEARVPDQADELSQPLFPLPASAFFTGDEFSRVRIEPEGSAVLTAAYPCGRDIVLRLWRPYRGEGEVRLEVEGASEIWLSNLRGDAERKLSEGDEVSLRMGHEEIVTLRARI